MNESTLNDLRKDRDHAKIMADRFRAAGDKSRAATWTADYERFQRQVELQEQLEHEPQQKTAPGK